jgi:prolyl 4-hydroxylase
MPPAQPIHVPVLRQRPNTVQKDQCFASSNALRGLMRSTYISRISIGVFQRPLIAVAALGVLVVACAVIIAHAHAFADSIPYTVETRSDPVSNPVICHLGEVCQPGSKRPFLVSNLGVSHAIWDMPRRHMNSRFEDVKKVIPGVSITYLWKEPCVVYFDNVLSDNDIKLLLDIATPRFSPSTIVQDDGSSIPAPGRTSDTAWIEFDSYDQVAAPVVAKLAQLAGFKSENAESLAVNRYLESQYFEMHYDFIHENNLYHDQQFPSICQRAATVLAYLSDDVEGGETVFARDINWQSSDGIDDANPDNLIVNPKKGRVLVWYNMYVINSRLLHPVEL